MCLHFIVKEHGFWVEVISLCGGGNFTQFTHWKLLINFKLDELEYLNRLIEDYVQVYKYGNQLFLKIGALWITTNFVHWCKKEMTRGKWCTHLESRLYANIWRNVWIYIWEWCQIYSMPWEGCMHAWNGTHIPLATFIRQQVKGLKCGL
jgi:hypothetical protein